ncbi:MAG TPA: 30S ribosomal protein S6 [Stellaceae bacterium]|nr:30S ribosomal protein S6 [Stellaceae bacterium]
MSFYETVFIARQDISAAQVEALADGFTQVIQDNGGKVANREYWGLRNISYRIKKNRKGHYVLLNIEAAGPAISEMERTMRINEDVLRYLTVRVEALESGPSVMMQARARGEERERGRRGGYGGDRYGDREPRESEAPAAAGGEA